MRGDVKNAFCAIRPPGHHAGPSGVVTSQRDPNGSHGFCLLNNVAIGAAYALNVYRHAGIQRVAILGEAKSRLTALTWTCASGALHAALSLAACVVHITATVNITPCSLFPPFLCTASHSHR